MKYYKQIVFLSILFTSCRSSKVFDREEKIRIDTIIDYKISTQSLPIHDTLTIENPCDSSGLLARFYSSLTIPSGRLKIMSQGQSIKATIDIDSVINTSNSKYKSNQTGEIKFYEKTVIKEVVPSWAILVILFESIIIIGYLYIRFFNPFK